MNLEELKKGIPEFEKLYQQYKKFMANQRLHEAFKAREQIELQELALAEEQSWYEANKKAIDIARNFLTKKTDPDLITWATGLTREEIVKISQV